MKNSLLKGFLVFLAMFFTSFAFSQTVSGVVSDSNGPLPGVSVKVKGNNNGQQTDFDGNYKIEAGADAVLVFTYVGFQTEEIKVAGRKTINVTLKSADEQLKEVVIIGYGSVRKKDATGAVDQLSAKSFDNVSAANPGQLLRGKAAGVQVTQSSGEPGAGLSLRVRGSASLRSGSDALIVVDGVPLAGGDISTGGSDVPGLGSSSSRSPLNFINQNDIESISILKDASSTAIYGARGANGVIIITTKKGKSKETELSYNSSIQFGSFASDFKMLSASEFLAAGGTPNGGASYNWEDVVLRNSFSTNHDVAFSKSTENSSTRVSLGANSTNGIVNNTGLDKYSATLFNSNDFFNGKLKIETRVGYTNLNDQATLLNGRSGFIGNVIGTALYWNPTRPVFDASGNYTQVSDTYLNPQQLLDSYYDRTKTNKLLASIKSTLSITKDLKYMFLFGIENSNSTRKIQLLPSMNIQGITTPGVSGGLASIQNLDNFNRTFEHTLTYNKAISNNFVLDAVAGFSFYDYNTEGSGVFAKNFNLNQTSLVDNLEGPFVNNNYTVTSFKNNAALQSYFGRTNITLYDKLILTGTIRFDGSSKLGNNDKYGAFPSIGLAYKVINNKEGLLNDIKIRGNYGNSGNSEFTVKSAINAREYQNGSEVDLNKENPNLRWETTTTTGVGIDFELLKNRLTGSFDVYNRDTKDLIFQVPAAAAQPAPPTAQFKNSDTGILNVKGIELTLNYKVINNEKFNWDISGNVSTQKSLIKDFPYFFILDTGEVNGPGLSGAFAQQITNGQPIYSYYLQEFLGYDASGNSVYAPSDGPGGKKFVGKQALPKMNVGFSTTFSYKRFDLTASFYGAFGHYIYNNTANALFFKSSLTGAGKNVTPDVLTSGQSASDGNPASTKYLEKGDFLRMGNLTIGYTFENNFLEKFKIKSARFYVNGSNLLLFTKYSGFDPEVDINKSLNGVPSAGIDYLSYPREKNIALGLNLTF